MTMRPTLFATGILACLTAPLSAAPIETTWAEFSRTCLQVVVKNERDALGPEPDYDLSNDETRARIYGLKIGGKTHKLTLKEDLTGEGISHVSCKLTAKYETLDDATSVRADVIEQAVQAGFVRRAEMTDEDPAFDLCTDTTQYTLAITWRELISQQDLFFYAAPHVDGYPCPF